MKQELLAEIQRVREQRKVVQSQLAELNKTNRELLQKERSLFKALQFLEGKTSPTSTVEHMVEVLRDATRPLSADEILEEMSKRGYPAPSDKRSIYVIVYTHPNLFGRAERGKYILKLSETSKDS